MSIWLEVCAKLEKILSSTDPVLAEWKDRLKEFQQHIPLLQQLASKALRVCLVTHVYITFATYYAFLNTYMHVYGMWILGTDY